jgi:hypothetical protein
MQYRRGFSVDRVRLVCTGLIETHMAPSAELIALLEYRMETISIGHLALQHSSSWNEIPSMKVYFGEMQVIEGKATGFTNGAIESAIIHCRALLEFLGIGAGKSAGTLRELTANRKHDDAGIESIDGLSPVTVAEALAKYKGSKTEAEAAFAYVIYLANKGLAHTTTTFAKHDKGTALVEIAFRGVPVLVANSFYIPLGIQPPAYTLPNRPRGD